MSCIRVILTVVIITWGVIASAPPVLADIENAYVRRNLVVNRSDPNDPTSPPLAAIIDPLLRNPWGAAIRSAGLGGHFWLANAASATVTTYVGDVYDESGNFVPLYQDDLKFITVEGSPIGQVFSASGTDFPVTGLLCSDDSLEVCDASQGDKFLGEFTGPSRFIVATEEGQIAAWTEGTLNGQFGRMRTFVTVLDNSQKSALYRGLAVTQRDSRNLLYAANFSQDRIEVYTSHWRPIPWVWTRHGFVRPFQKPADIPANYVPFNIQSLNGLLYVAYAELIRPGDPDYDPEEPFAERTCGGCGYVAVFNWRGLHVRTLEGRGRLNAPWGLAIAPENFGRFSNALLVGNFGDGTIVGFDPTTGQQIDYLRDPQGKIIAIDGLWAIFFGNGASLGRADFLYWTAGFNEETDGGFGSLNYIGTPNPDPSAAAAAIP
jgi:uncharacterized protein (TIGR03118 family)